MPNPSTSAQPATLRASFNPLIRSYLLLNVGLVMIFSIIGIPLAVIWFCGVGQWWARHYFAKLECELGPTALRFRKGIIVQVERTVPLENIQDVTFIEGPLLKYFNLSILKFETAGQSTGQAHDMQLIGIVDAHEMRAQILSRRQELRNRQSQQQAPAASPPDDTAELLRAILGRLDQVVEHLRRKA